MIELNHVSLTFDDTSNQTTYTAIKDLTLTIDKGKLYTIIGGNGSGKSTLLKVLTGILKPTRGNITFNSIDITEQRKHYLERIGYCPQQVDQVFFHHTVREELDFSTINKSKTEALIKLYHLQPLLDLSPFQLSSGQKKTLVYVLATLSQPDVLILDEITAGLDHQNKALIMKDILQYKSQRHTVMVTHDLETALTYSDVIVFFHEMSIVFVGSPHSFLNRSDLLRQTGFSLPDIYIIQTELIQKNILPPATMPPTIDSLSQSLIRLWGDRH